MKLYGAKASVYVVFTVSGTKLNNSLNGTETKPIAFDGKTTLINQDNNPIIL